MTLYNTKAIKYNAVIKNTPGKTGRGKDGNFYEKTVGYDDGIGNASLRVRLLGGRANRSRHAHYGYGHPIRPGLHPEQR